MPYPKRMTQYQEQHFATYADFEAYLMQKGLFHMDLSLDRMTTVLEELELARPPYVVAQVVGTNGKGSTSAFLSSLGQATGLTTGLYTSPHFVTPRERIRVNGQMLDEDVWCELASDVIDAGGDSLTYFEFLTVLAVLAFYDYEVDLAVFEAGLGGKHDATTGIERDITVFTPFALDHENVLGSRIEDIAHDKAAAITPAALAVTGEQEGAAMKVLREAAAQGEIPLELAHDHGTLPEGVQYGLAGAHQKDNARLALAAYKLLVQEHNWEPPDFMTWDDVKDIAVADAWMPGRLQVVAGDDDYPSLLLDGAHNGHGLNALRQALKDMAIQPRVVIFGCMQDKALSEVLPHIQALQAERIFLPPITDNDRALPATVLQEALGEKAVITASMDEALRGAKAYLMAEDTAPEAAPADHDTIEVLLCGSLYLLAEFFTLRPDSLENA